MSSSSYKHRIIKHGKTKGFEHDHHRAGSSDLREIRGSPAPSRFPGVLYECEDENGKFPYDNDFEVEGFEGFYHVRCPNRPSVSCSCGRFSCHLDSMIIAIDGSCPGNGTDAASQSAIGVYFGNPENDLAMSIRDTSGYPHTSQRAELYAALAGLQAAKKYAANGGQWKCHPETCRKPCRVKHLVVKSDSAYVVNSLTSHVQKWKSNGWKTAKGTPVCNKDLFERILKEVEDYDRLDTLVEFWHVRRKRNEEADNLALQGHASNRFFAQCIRENGLSR